MDLVVTTPGVSTAAVRTALESESRDRLLVIDRATRCGSTTVDPTTARRLRVAVTPCAVSLHAADRFCRRLVGAHPVDGTDSVERTDSADETGSVDGTGSVDETDSVDGIVVCRRHGRSAPDSRLEARFDCPVSAIAVDGDRSPRGRYCER